MADVWPANGSIHIPPRVATCYLGPDADQDDGGDMDYEDRLRAVEMASQHNSDMIAGHERECSLRYKQLVDGQGRIMASIKYLAFSVGALALVVLGVATVHDLVRGGAARIGVPMPAQAAPQQPYPQPYPR